MAQKLNELALGYSLAVIFGLGMLLLGVLGPVGFYPGAMNAMMQWHMFFWLSPLGIILGIIEAGIIGFIAGWLVAKLYNKFAQ